MHATQKPVSPATTRPATPDTLRRAALYLIRHGWTRLSHYTPPPAPVTQSNSDVFPAADVLGALVLAVTGRPLLPGELVHECAPDVVAEFDHATVYLAAWLGMATTRGLGILARSVPELIARQGLMTWNDAPWQDQAHVIDGLLCAAADADGTVYDPDIHRPYAADFAALGLTAGGAR